MPAKFYCHGAKMHPKLCDYVAETRWTGLCPKCSRLYDIDRTGGDDDDMSRMSLGSLLANAKMRERISTGIPELDLVLGGGGIVQGANVLLGGPRGVGKSTLLMQVAAGAAAGGTKVLFCSGEQSRQDIIEYAIRIGVTSDLVDIIGNPSGLDAYEIVQTCEDVKAKLLILDSLQVCSVDDVNADVGQVAQIDAVMNYITSFGKKKNVSSIVINHLNKAGDFAGSEKAQHLCDCLLRFSPAPQLDADGDVIEESISYRELSIDGKNRFGPDDATAMMKMTPSGLVSIVKEKKKKKSSIYLLREREDIEAGKNNEE